MVEDLGVVEVVHLAQIAWEVGEERYLLESLESRQSCQAYQLIRYLEVLVRSFGNTLVSQQMALAQQSVVAGVEGCQTWNAPRRLCSVVQMESPDLL